MRKDGADIAAFWRRDRDDRRLLFGGSRARLESSDKALEIRMILFANDPVGSQTFQIVIRGVDASTRLLGSHIIHGPRVGRLLELATLHTFHSARNTSLGVDPRIQAATQPRGHKLTFADFNCFSYGITLYRHDSTKMGGGHSGNHILVSEGNEFSTLLLLLHANMVSEGNEFPTLFLLIRANLTPPDMYLE